MGDIQEIDIDKEAWEEIKKAASESKWMPKGYMMNDWVSDVCRFLREGDKSPTLKRETRNLNPILFV